MQQYPVIDSNKGKLFLTFNLRRLDVRRYTVTTEPELKDPLIREFEKLHFVDITRFMNQIAFIKVDMRRRRDTDSE